MEALHKILRPFLLRRVKSDVEENLLPSKLLLLRLYYLMADFCFREGDQYICQTNGDAAEVVSFRLGKRRRRGERFVVPLSVCVALKSLSKD